MSSAQYGRHPDRVRIQDHSYQRYDIRDTVDRVESFVTLAAQTEQELASGRTPTYATEDVLAAAVTGWVLGAASAEPKVEAAERAWAARQFVLSQQGATVRTLDLLEAIMRPSPSHYRAA